MEAVSYFRVAGTGLGSSLIWFLEQGGESSGGLGGQTLGGGGLAVRAGVPRALPPPGFSQNRPDCKCSYRPEKQGLVFQHNLHDVEC